MTRQRAFQTAAARRRANPIVWTIDDKVIKLRPSVDLAEIADLVEQLQAPLAEGENAIKAGAVKREILLSIVSTFIEEPSKPHFDEVSVDIDAGLLNEMLEELVAEYTGQSNPTQASPSPDGLSETGNSLTAGAALVE
jgi:hypothetical protein